MKSIVYVDGYNLYYGCLKHSGDKWLDLQALFTRILYEQNPASDIVSIKFFTADIKAKVASQGQAAQIAQQSYHRALELLYPTQLLNIIKGYYSLEKASLLAFKTPPDKTHRLDVWRLEEKQTDVNLALEAYRDASKENAKQLVFVSNDTDLAPALNAIREDFGDSLKIGVILPIRASTDHRPGNQQLSKYADWTRKHITNDELAQSHLPDIIPTNKKPIRKPEYW